MGIFKKQPKKTQKKQIDFESWKREQEPIKEKYRCNACGEVVPEIYICVNCKQKHCWKDGRWTLEKRSCPICNGKLFLRMEMSTDEMYKCGLL